jgi:hypothetical protein
MRRLPNGTRPRNGHDAGVDKGPIDRAYGRVRRGGCRLSDRLALTYSVANEPALSTIGHLWRLSGGTYLQIERFQTHRLWRLFMGRGLLLWLIGIPIPIILLIWLFGGLH